MKILSCDTHQVTKFDIYYNFDTGWVGRLIDNIFAVVYGHHAFTYILVQRWSRLIKRCLIWSCNR